MLEEPRVSFVLKPLILLVFHRRVVPNAWSTPAPGQRTKGAGRIQKDRRHPHSTTTQPGSESGAAEAGKLSCGREAGSEPYQQN